MKAKDIKIGRFYQLKDTPNSKLLVDKVEKTTKRRAAFGIGSWGGDTRVYGTLIDARTGKALSSPSNGYALSKIIGPWDDAFYAAYLEELRADAIRREDTERLGTAIVEALARRGCKAEYRAGEIIVREDAVRALYETLLIADLIAA